MKLIRYQTPNQLDPFTELSRWFREPSVDLEPLSRLFGGRGGPFGDLFRGETESLPLNVHETDSAYVLEFEIPGVKRQDVSLSLEPENVLRLKVSFRDQSVEGDAETRAEASRGIRLPDAAARDGFEAQLADGILTVTVPKKAETQARVIEIK
jgi:HSP20 family protein